MVPANLDEFPLGEAPRSGVREKLIAAGVGGVVVLAALVFAFTRPDPSIQSRLEDLVADAESFDCVVGLRVMVSEGRVTEAQQREARRYHVTYGALLRRQGADAIASSVTKTKDGRGRAIVAAADCE